MIYRLSPAKHPDEVLPVEVDMSAVLLPGERIDSASVQCYKLYAYDAVKDEWNLSGYDRLTVTLEGAGRKTDVISYVLRGQNYAQLRIPSSYTPEETTLAMTPPGQVEIGPNAESPSPLMATLIAIDTGNLEVGDRSYKVTFIDSSGNETTPSVASNIVTVDASHKQVRLTDIPVSSSPLVTGRKIYRTEAGGSIYKLLTTINDNIQTEYIDNISDSSLGATAPTINTLNQQSQVAFVLRGGEDGGRYLIVVTVQTSDEFRYMVSILFDVDASIIWPS